MSDVIAKLVIWTLVGVGLTPVVVLGLLTLMVLTIDAATLPQPSANGAILREHRDLNVGMIGGGSIGLDSWHPRLWVGLTLLAGAALVVVGLFFLLHIPPRR